MKDNFKMIKLMVKENSSGLMGLNIMENGNMINKMDGVKKFYLMELVIKDILYKVFE